MTGDSTCFAPTPERSRDLRDAFGAFGTGVTVVTAQTPDGPLGMTANSFSSISLDPALVLWAPARRSLRHDAFVAAPHFCIHVLAADQESLALHFATKGQEFAGLDAGPGPFGAPRLNGVRAEFHCDTHAVHDAGDHSIVLGLVRHVVHHRRAGQGLLFEAGRFGYFTPQPQRP